MRYEQRLEQEEKPEIHELITQNEIDANINRIQSQFNVDLEDVIIHSAKPGDSIFDQHEIQYKLFQKCDSDLETLFAKIRSHGYDPKNISIESLRDIANKEKITLDGNLPGFAMTAGNNEIVFFAVKDSNAVKMATNYAAKEGESKLVFNASEEAVNYLRKLANKAFLHEVAHIIYARGKFDEWDKYISEEPKIKQDVIRLQQDKYTDIKQIPIEEEAFADFAVEVLSNGRISSRLGKNKKATDKIRAYLKRNKMVA